METSFTDKDKLAEDLTRMLERGSLNDVKIKLSDGDIVANKDILMARSDYFATMLSNNKFSEGETGLVDMSHCSKAVMEKIIKYIFSGTIKFKGLSLIQLLELSHMSEMMLLDEVKAKVDDLKTKYYGGDKFLLELISGLKFANKNNLSSLKPWIIEQLYHRMKEVPNDAECSDSFKSLPIELIVDLFVFRGTGRKLPTTMEKLEVFMVWLSANETTDKRKNDIVDSFDFEDFTVEELMTTIRESGLYPAKKIDERVLDLVKNKDQLLSEKDLKIKELNDTLQDAKKYIPSYHLHRFRS